MTKSDRYLLTYYSYGDQWNLVGLKTDYEAKLLYSVGIVYFCDGVKQMSNTQMLSTLQ